MPGIQHHAHLKTSSHLNLKTTLWIVLFILFLLFFFLMFIYLFIWLHWVFYCCIGAFSSCSEQGLLFVVVHRFLIVVASLVSEHGL